MENEFWKDSPFGENSIFHPSWDKLKETERQNRIKSDNEDFLPIVRINRSEKSKNSIVSYSDCNKYKKEVITLSEDFDKELQNYIVPEIVIAKSLNSLIALQNIQGYDGIGYQDGDGVLEFRCSSLKVNLKFLNNSNPFKCSDTTKSYDVKDAGLGDEYTLQITHTLNRGDKFYIEIYASDDNDGFWGKSNKVVKCGKLNFTIVQQDVFMEDEINRWLDELTIISQKHKKNPKSGEYSVNYCIQGADRFLGAIVQNKQDFYTYDDKNEKVLNIPDLSNAIKRAKKIQSLGYGASYVEFLDSDKDVIFGFSEIQKKDDYGNLPTRNLYIKNKNRVNSFIEKMVGNKIGFHVFYLSIVDALHTLLIVIDNTEPCLATYRIYDEDGLTSSMGSLTDLENGLKNQSQWVYIWTKSKIGYWARLNISLLKFKRKS